MCIPIFFLHNPTVATTGTNKTGTYSNPFIHAKYVESSESCVSITSCITTISSINTNVQTWNIITIII